jgi:hypothetical protein
MGQMMREERSMGSWMGGRRLDARSGPARLAAALLLGTVLPPLLAAQAKTPTQAYLEYRTVAAQATSLEQLFPYLSKEWRGLLDQQPAGQRPEWLGRLRDWARVRELAIVKETVTGDEGSLEVTGREATGQSTKGLISLVQEDGAWKLDEEAWATELPRP